MEGIALRYGFFYGPRTWYSPEGACGEQARRGQISIIGKGEGVWSFIHIEDAAHATVLALSAPKGVYHIVDDDPSPVSVWLPAFARWVGAPTPPALSESEARRKPVRIACITAPGSAALRTQKRNECSAFIRAGSNS